MRLRIPYGHYRFINDTKNDRYSIMYGGRRSGKTYSRLIHLYQLSLSEPGLKIQVIGSTSPIIRAGVLSDFDNLFARREGVDYTKNLSSLMYTFNNGTTIQFIQCDTPAKALQLGRASYRFINEANNIDKETFDNLAISTERQVFLDFNPTEKFWVDEISTEKNTRRFNWYDNVFLNPNIKQQFKEWTEIGKRSRIGSPEYWRWQVYCEGLYCSLCGDLINIDDLKFINEASVPNCLRYIAFVDPSNMHGGDSFAACLVGQDKQGCLYMLDSYSKNNGSKYEVFNKLKAWKETYPQCQIYIERNGQIGQRFYDDCVSSGLSVMSYWSTNDTFHPIFANLPTLKEYVYFVDTPDNNAYIQQFAAFTQENCKQNTDHDDNLDCLNNVLILLQSRRLLRTPLFQ